MMWDSSCPHAATQCYAQTCIRLATFTFLGYVVHHASSERGAGQSPSTACSHYTSLNPGRGAPSAAQATASKASS
eukprot:1707864-Pyramimonas_sp.AAC.1